MKVGVSLANTKDMRLGALDASGMPLTVVDFRIFPRNEFFDSIYLSRVDDFLIVTTNDRLILLRRYCEPPIDSSPNPGISCGPYEWITGSSRKTANLTPSAPCIYKILLFYTIIAIDTIICC